MGLFDIISKPLEPSQLEQPVGWGTPTEDWDYTLEMDNYIQKLKKSQDF